MTETASVASRPEYCFNRRSTESGTVSKYFERRAGLLGERTGEGVVTHP